MSSNFDVIAQPRTTSGKGASRRLRRAGLVPCIVYGARREPEMVTVPHNALLKHLDDEAFYSSVLNLKVGDASTTVVLKDMQRHPAKPFVLHVDFMRVSQDEKLRMAVPFHFINEAACKGVKLGGQVLHPLTEVEILCLPKNLPEFIAIEMADMEIGDSIHLSAVQLPEGVEFTPAQDLDVLIVAIYAPRGGSDDETEEGEDAAES